VRQAGRQAGRQAASTGVISRQDTNAWRPAAAARLQLAASLTPWRCWLQVLSACAVAFSHGANEVGNGIGPFNAAYFVYINMRVPTSSSVDCPQWILAFGALSLVVGLFFYGHPIMKVLGVKCTHISPARGFCMETATSFVVSIATVFKIPLSTTHTITGAVAGPGLAERGLKSINLKM
jgi:sodium-dependent phosphate transporter